MTATHTMMERMNATPRIKKIIKKVGGEEELMFVLAVLVVTERISRDRRRRRM